MSLSKTVVVHETAEHRENILEVCTPAGVRYLSEGDLVMLIGAVEAMGADPGRLQRVKGVVFGGRNQCLLQEERSRLLCESREEIDRLMSAAYLLQTDCHMETE